jgi:hypothetical protein
MRIRMSIKSRSTVNLMPPPNKRNPIRKGEILCLFALVILSGCQAERLPSTPLVVQETLEVYFTETPLPACVSSQY